MGEIIYKELSYKIIGLIYEVYNSIGYGYREKYYQRALAEEFKTAHLNFKAECPITLKYKGKIIGKYFMDFLVDDKVIVELKIANDFYTKDLKQVFSYIKSTNLKLGILVIINKIGVQYKRIVN